MLKIRGREMSFADLSWTLLINLTIFLLFIDDLSGKFLTASIAGPRNMKIVVVLVLVRIFLKIFDVCLII